jgi:NhaP-type Na+/H+ or K+/H+ antiporter
MHTNGLIIQGVAAILAQGGGPPLSLTAMLALTGCALGLVVGILVLGFLVSLRKRGFEDEDKQESKKDR